MQVRRSTRPWPCVVPVPVGEVAGAVAAGGDYSLVLTEQGHVLVCGRGDHGEPGHGNRVSGNRAAKRVNAPCERLLDRQADIHTFCFKLGRKSFTSILITWYKLERVKLALPVRDPRHTTQLPDHRNAHIDLTWIASGRFGPLRAARVA